MTATFLFGKVHSMNIAARKLATWLEAEGVPKGVFANRVNVGPPTVSRLLSGERTPSLELATRISKQTAGFVTPDDWVTPPAERQEQTEVAA